MNAADFGGPSLLAVAILLIVSPTARATALILGVIMASIGGIMFLAPPFLVWRCYEIWSQYQSELTAEEEGRRWSAACKEYAYRTPLFNPPLTPNKPIAERRGDRANPRLVTLAFIAALMVGYYLGLNT